MATSKITAVVPQGKVGLAVFRVGLQALQTGRQIVSPEIAPQTVAVAVGFIGPFFSPQKVPLIRVQLFWIEMMLPGESPLVQRPAGNHHLDILELQPLPFGQLDRMTEPADDKEQLLPGLQRRVPNYRVGLGLTGKMGDAHLGQWNFLPVLVHWLPARSHPAGYEKIPAGASGSPRL